MVPDLRLRCKQSGGKNGKRQVHSAVNTWNSAMLLCAVTEVYRRHRKTVLQNPKSECSLYTGGTWESVGKPGKQTRRKIVLTKSFNLRKSSISTGMEIVAGKTAVRRAERNAFRWGFQQALPIHVKS